MKKEGFTLIEAVIVVATVGTLAAVLVFSFEGWSRPYAIESQMKQMHADLMLARARALERSRFHFVELWPGRYRVREDVSPWPDGDGDLTSDDDEGPPGYTEPVPLLDRTIAPEYPLVWSGAADTRIAFNTHGLSNDAKTICVNARYEADYSCIEISRSRINLGKLAVSVPDGGECNAENCFAK
ncbi:MAG: GspH/FimT family pseudopilin [Nitrospirae bacterium]|nr:GspH/FimT family pseudopilin [Nitrospirota bacterium]